MFCKHLHKNYLKTAGKFFGKVENCQKPLKKDCSFKLLKTLSLENFVRFLVDIIGDIINYLLTEFALRTVKY